MAAIITAAAAKQAKQQAAQQQPEAQQAQAQRHSRRAQQGSSSLVELLDSDEPSQGQPAAVHCSTGVLSEQARMAAEREAALRQQLEEAAAAGLEDEEEDEEDLVGELPTDLLSMLLFATKAAACSFESRAD